MKLTALLGIAILMGGCAAPSPPTPAPAIPTVDTSIPPTDTTTTTAPQSGACPGGEVMLADGRLLHFDRDPADGERISGIGWRMAGDCQVVTIAFSTEDGAPATTPPAVTARLIREAGILRVETAATGAVIVDQLVDEGLVDRLFVPVDPDGRRFVDLVLSEPAVARARVFTSPARLEIELQPGGGEFGRPLIGPRLVLVEPGSNPDPLPILDVTGYVWEGIDSIQVTVTRGGLVVTSTVFELSTTPRLWSGFHVILPMGDEAYDTMEIATGDGAFIAAIPFNR